MLDGQSYWEQLNRPIKRQWYEEAEADGLLTGNGKRAKRLKQLAKKNRRKQNKRTESRGSVRGQLGKKIWGHEIAGLAVTGKPRGVKKQIPALPATNS
jgi:hypothetical protein